MDYQGGKQFGKLKQQQALTLDEVNKRYLDDDDYKDEEEYPNFHQTLLDYKAQFISFDLDGSGDIDLMELKMMMEKLGQAKTHLELKKMIAEVDRDNKGTISYDDFLFMMLGNKTSVLKLVLKFEEKMKGKERPKGVAPKRDLSSLP